MDDLNNILDKLSHLNLIGQIEDIQATARGLGASCDVFTGYWRAGNKKVAVKKLRVFLTKEEQVIKKLAREVYIWSKLEHENVLPLLGFFLEGGEFPHLVSEWMAKGTLRDYMPYLGGDEDIVAMCLGIAAGLSYLHEKGVIHADLKSLNILISEAGKPLLADFGVSHVLAASMTKMCGTTMASTKGTVRWMAIELLSLSDESGVGVTPDEKSDVWAFGMTIYEILKRNVPYNHLKNDHQVALAISKGKLPERPARSEKASLPMRERKLWDICGSCWKKKPEMRPSMSDILSDITAIQDGKSRPVKRRKLDITPLDNPATLHASTLSQPNGMFQLTFDAHYAPNAEAPHLVQDPRIGADISPLTTPAFSSPPSYLDDNVTYIPYDLNISGISSQRKKEGSDWSAIFNPDVKRRLDVYLLFTWPHESVVCSVRFSTDGKFLATGSNRITHIYDVRTGAKICGLIDEHAAAEGDLYIRSVCFSPDGKYLATGAEDKIIRVWDIAKRRIRRVFEGHCQEIYALVFSLDGRLLASGSGDGTTRVWNMESGIPKVLEATEPQGVDTGVASVAISPNNSLVAAGSVDCVVRIWDVATGSLVECLREHSDNVYGIAFTPDGKSLISGSLDKTLKQWDITPLTRPDANRSFLPPMTPARSIQNSTMNDTATMDGGERSSKCTSTFFGHTDYVLTTAISHDGQWVVSGSKDHGVQFWDRETTDMHMRIEAHTNSVVSVDLSSQGGLLATGGGDWTARIWRYTSL
ncbi:WD40 repeat-like protein [Schizopora paradoxa]|uniref:WD40 repeat-like protein n=1 Tax=Schizopora paradoxa TaxID=27342 RepID=A0A0H2SC35_9AGAM|nr:WD40 repeat-like protein [Schizopora paradoxa]